MRWTSRRWYSPALSVLMLAGSALVAWAQPTPPSVITSSVRFPQNTTTAVVTITWGDSPNEDSYVLERSTNGGAFTTLATLGIDSTGYTNNNLPLATDFSYRVKAVNAGGSSYSAVTTVRTPNPYDGFILNDVGNCVLVGNWNGSR